MGLSLNRREVLATAAIAGAGVILVSTRIASAVPARPPAIAPTTPPSGITPSPPIAVAMTSPRLAPLGNLGYDAAAGKLVLPKLPYAYNELEPAIDAETMEIHYTKHHQKYVDEGNKFLAGTPLASMPPEAVITQLDMVQAPDIRTKIKNNVGGHVNHSMFWQLMAKPGSKGTGEPSGSLADAINKTLGGFNGFKTKFAAAAGERFGSGWAWLVVRDGALAIVSTANQDNPLMGITHAGTSGHPLLGLDVWEHAYYLKYRNKRPDYVTAWFTAVNWDKVALLHAAATNA